MGEIENALLENDKIADALVHAWESTGGGKSLCAYLVSEVDGLTIPEVKDFLKARLPDYMIPENYIFLEKMPLSPNGKIDRNKLPRPNVTIKQKKHRPPVTQREKILVSAWSKVLCQKDIGCEDDFFSLGGDSIKAMLIMAHIYEQGFQFTMKDLFLNPTISSLANSMKVVVKHGEKLVQNSLTPVISIPNDELAKIMDYLRINLGHEGVVKNIYPLTPTQQTMLFYSLFNRGQRTFVQQYSFNIQGNFDIGIFTKSMERIIERHDILRTVFIYKGYRVPLQIVYRERPLEIHHKDLTAIESDKREEYIQVYKKDDRNRGFSLNRDNLMRITVFKTNEDRWKLIWSHHHILLDGWCMGIIAREVLSIYNALLNNMPIALESPTPYYTYLNWLAKQNKEAAFAFWKSYLAGCSAKTGIMKLATGLISGPYRQVEVEFRFNKNLTASLMKLAAQNAVTLNILFQTMWGVLLQVNTGESDVIFGAVVSGRPPELADIGKMVGLFINAVPVRLRIRGEDRFVDIMKSLQNRSVDNEQYSYFSLMDIQQAVGIKRDLFDHVIAFENFPLAQQLAETIEHFVFTDDGILQQTHYHFNVIVIPGEELIIKFNYNGAVFSQNIIESLKKQLLCLAGEISSVPDIKLAALHNSSALKSINKGSRND